MARNDCLTRFSRHKGPFLPTLAADLVICRECRKPVRASEKDDVVAPARPRAYPSRVAEPVAVARSDDRWTSHAAAAAVTGIRQSQREVYDLLLSPKCDEELIAAARDAGVKQSDSGLRSRRDELVDLGLVKDSGRTRATASGRRTIVWERA